jgi:hypothetical protein
MQRKASTDAAAASLSLPSGGGQALPPEVRAKLEPALGANLSAVRIRQGPEAASVGALAFTRGSDIFFAPGRFDPHSEPGLALLGHELAHVVQQRDGRVSGDAGPVGGLHVDAALEAEADGVGARVSRGEPVGGSHGASPGRAPTTGRAATSVLAQPKLRLTHEFRSTPQNEGAFLVVQKNLSALGEMVLGVFNEGNRFNLTFDMRDFDDKDIFARTAIRYESVRSSGNVDTGALPNLRDLWECTSFDVTVYVNSSNPRAGDSAEIMANLVHELTVHVMSQAKMLVLLRSCRNFQDFNAQVKEHGLLQKGGSDDVDVEHDEFSRGENSSYHLLATKIWMYLSTPGPHHHPELAKRFSVAAAADVLSHNDSAMAKVIRNDPELKDLYMREAPKGEMNTNDFARLILQKYPDLVMKFLCP